MPSRRRPRHWTEPPPARVRPAPAIGSWRGSCGGSRRGPGARGGNAPPVRRARRRIHAGTGHHHRRHPAGGRERLGRVAQLTGDSRGTGTGRRRQVRRQVLEQEDSTPPTGRRSFGRASRDRRCRRPPAPRRLATEPAGHRPLEAVEAQVGRHLGHQGLHTLLLGALDHDQWMAGEHQSLELVGRARLRGRGGAVAVSGGGHSRSAHHAGLRPARPGP